ncbi:TetR/AcrR family transcriptional regulator [Prauserella sp. PE36]|uniref:Helix-turn-helix transcriptional regulator n=1 Tax=Prauserella endophytica TaxID=1592324 RepID=A0ABY2S234_9PSEU|nr:MULTISPECIES: helix-turn-helix domain-containing protein [Prauserella]PXY25230.1 TetR family transcriptional regulator [Prauserella coralliicola]RBM23394.1 TetR/AcrR family transcriptional regulator [Prauserella sp. PE36]TKG69278.1 helix-turn-helix transcriptional regulator [Prauserella endophytica]
MARTFREDVDERILDRAAALFAQRGYAHTSLQSLADAVGLSKAGLLHHFPSKDALYQAAMNMWQVQGRTLFDPVIELPVGPERDRRAVELLIDFALERPGLVALASRSITTLGSEEPDPGEEAGEFAFAVFGIDPETDEPERVTRVLGMLGALVVLILAANHLGDKTTWRRHILATCLDTLGHRSPGLSSTDHVQVEA